MKLMNTRSILDNISKELEINNEEYLYYTMLCSFI